VRQRRYCTARDSIVDGGLPRIHLLQLSSWVFVCVGTVGGPSWVVLVSAVCCIVILMLPLSTDHSAPVAAAGDGWSLYCSLHVSLHQKLIAAYILGTVRPADRPTHALSVCLSVCLFVSLAKLTLIHALSDSSCYLVMTLCLQWLMLLVGRHKEHMACKN